MEASRRFCFHAHTHRGQSGRMNTFTSQAKAVRDSSAPSSLSRPESRPQVRSRRRPARPRQAAWRSCKCAAGRAQPPHTAWGEQRGRSPRRGGAGGEGSSDPRALRSRNWGAYQVLCVVTNQVPAGLQCLWQSLAQALSACCSQFVALQSWSYPACSETGTGLCSWHSLSWLSPAAESSGCEFNQGICGFVKSPPRAQKSLQWCGVQTGEQLKRGDSREWAFVLMLLYEIVDRHS